MTAKYRFGWVKYRGSVSGRPRSLDTCLSSWLLDESSLTQRLRSRCEGGFSVQLLRQSRHRPLPDECALLQIPRREPAVIRQVMLCCHGTPWVFARTIIPFSTLQGPQWRLTRLGNRPLGEVLFTDHNVKRGPLMPVYVVPGQPLHAMVRAASEGRALWGRRSLFWYGDLPLLVCELFLPRMWHQMAKVKGVP